MKALTLHQPWASLVAIGAKRYETRSWFTHYRGPLAIHASQEFPAAARRLAQAEPFATALLGNAENLPLGCIVAVVRLHAVYPTAVDGDGLALSFADAQFPSSELPFGDFSPGRFAWQLTELRALENPIPARGARSLWEWDESLFAIPVMQPQQKQYRQGDVLIERVSRLPSKPTRNKKGERIILAHGEVTGHAHEIARPELASIEECTAAVELLGDLEGAGATMTHHALEVRADTDVIHQEHATIPIEKGSYIVRRQREYSPEAIRNVAD